jgi:hypothetical protein
MHWRRGSDQASDESSVATMKIFLADARTPPARWHLVLWPDEAIPVLKTNTVTDLSLDHDFGEDRRGTGYDVLLRIEEAVALADFKQFRIAIHSANSAARLRMDASARSIDAQRRP